MLDTNIPIYAAGKAHAYKLPCAWVLHEIVEDRLSAVVDTETIQEILYRFGGAGQWQVAVEMCTNLMEIVSAVCPVQAADVAACIELCKQYGLQGLPARDLLHVAVMRANGLDTIISTDVHFDRVAGIRRLDPKIMYDQSRRQS
jgi:predicted nucleic acid-binding protein